MIITVASGKGGVGKSNFVANLGIALAEFGVDVVILDGNLTNGDLGCILGPPFPKKTIHNVIADGVHIRDAVFQHPTGVRLVASSLSVDDVGVVEPHEMRGLAESLDGIADVVLMDAPGTLGRNTIESLKLADKVILITTPEITSYANTLKTKKIAEKHGVEVLGTVVNKVRRNRAKIEKETKDWMGTDVLGMLPYDENVIESVEYGRPVLHHRPYSDYSIEIKRFGAALADVEYAPPSPVKRFLAKFIKF
ncbi:MAG: P-loop NTPase [Candidatus Micrarchaeota archaeon]|nr:P-loop NTPase [Candidatus Micrarchaeota archaeon]